MSRYFIPVVFFLSAACRPIPVAEYGGESNGGTGASTEAPSWLDGTSTQYPDNQFLSGVGHGESRTACENDARAAIAKTLSVHIQQDSSDWQSHFSKVNESGMERVEAASISHLTRVSTDYVLKGTRVAETWRGPRATHCLAVLERIPVARSLRDEIDRMDVQIAAKVREGDEAPNATAKFFAYKRAMELLQRREALNSELRIISPNRAGKRPTIGWDAIVAKFTRSQSKVKLGLKLSGKDAKRMQTCLMEQLSTRGISVIEGTSDVDLMVHGALRWRWTGKIMGSFMVNASLNLRVTDVENGATLAAFTETVKTGRPQRAMSIQSASNKLCRETAPKLAERVERALAPR